jgi:nucleoside-diphosphate-sugar epimerase
VSVRIVVTGAAGLVGQNLIPRLEARGHTDIVAIDKHRANSAILRRLHPDLAVVEADLAKDDGWQALLADAEVVICAHAQIGGLDEAAFTANNVIATQRLIAAIRPDTYVVHLSSSVVESAADDWYVRSKNAQEKLIVDSGLPAVVLRPTLMFGWFDRKHLGWLARFMRKVPVFPIPGSGRYLRQPLYVGDLCDIILACIAQRPTGQVYNISGQQRIDYIDLIRALREACGARAAIVRVPYPLFWLMLHAYGIFDRDPPFTTRQLEALVTPDVFEIIDWPAIFGVRATPLQEALTETFRHPPYSQIVLEF